MIRVTLRSAVQMFVTASLLLASFPAAAQTSKFVTARGKEIVDPGGKPLLLRGINLGNWLVPEGYMFRFDSTTSPRMINAVISEMVGPERAREFWAMFRDAYITADDIHAIRRQGFNSVRVPFNWRLFAFEEQANAWTDTGFSYLDRVIRWCRNDSLWVILDMHCAPGGQTGDNIDDSWGYPFLFDSPEEQDRTAHIWRNIAARYKDEPIVLGYDLLNEPIPHFVDVDRLNPKLEPFYRKVVAAIRQVDRNHLIILGGAQWDTNFKVFGPPFDDKLIYTFHKYWCATGQEVVQEYVDYRDRYNVPIWLGESGENTDGWIEAFRGLLERNNIGWCFWPYKKMDSPRCVMTFDRPDGWDALMAYARGPRGGYASIRAHRPPAEDVWKSLKEFVRLSGFAQCRPNPGYLEALGLGR